jgi:DNA-binding transcriptional regulator GbsR (MarR family)
MEEIHSLDAYPRNFFGVLTVLLVDDTPVTQDRIIEITGYSRASVSLALQKIQLLMPLRAAKKEGDRRNYYEYGGAYSDFILDLMTRRIETPDIDPYLVEAVQKKAEAKAHDSDAYTRLSEHLKALGLTLLFIHRLRAMSMAPLKQALEEGTIKGVKLPDLSGMSLPVARREFETEPWRERPSEYYKLKHEFFQGMKKSLNPMYAQGAANMLIVVHDVMIEGVTTQQEIQSSTSLPRSTISTVLKHGLDRGILKVRRPEHSRVKLYSPSISIVELLMSHYQRSYKYAEAVREKLRNLLGSIDSHDTSLSGLRGRLLGLEFVYDVLAQFTREILMLVKERASKEQAPA